jgi:Ca2+-binding RTX toxin-like protein
VSVENEKVPIAINIEGYGPIVPLKDTADANSLVWLYDGDSGSALAVGFANNGSWSLPTFPGQSNSVRDYVLKASDLSGNTVSAHLVTGSAGNDTVTNSAPNEFFLGNGGNDTFVFSGNIGKDTVVDFNAGADVVQFSHDTFANFASVLANAAQVGSDVTITVDQSNSVTLHNTTLSQLINHNVHIV